MVSLDFDIIETEKLGGSWEQSLAVVREREVFLRLVGDGKDYRVMTATAGEDLHRYNACQDQERLCNAAISFADKNGCTAEADKDGKGRTYIQLFILSQDDGASDQDFTDEVNKLVGDFFSIYDSIN